ncbi:MAG: NADP-dependent oxidoreductase [Solirubrobacteraceae bacterium]
MIGRQIQLEHYPRDEVGPRHFALVEVPVREPAEGEVLVRNTWTSVDPGLRLRMREQAPNGYFSAFELGRPMDGIMAVGEVLESRAAGFAPGDTVWHASGWRDYAVVQAGVGALSGLGTLRRLDTTMAPARSYLGPLGGMGLTGYAGLLQVAGLRRGDTVWVSAAAGAVGSLAAQFGKLRGARVIGSAGSDEKVRFLLDELKLDAAFNYKNGPVDELVAKAAPDGIDVYFDNVGGEHLEAALGSLRRHGRVALCGAVAQYNSGGTASEAAGPRNLFQATANELTLRGFRGSSYVGLLDEMQREVGAWIRDGRLRYRETVWPGLEHAPEALARMLAGESMGKTLVSIPPLS